MYTVTPPHSYYYLTHNYSITGVLPGGWVHIQGLSNG